MPCTRALAHRSPVWLAVATHRLLSSMPGQRGMKLIVSSVRISVRGRQCPGSPRGQLARRSSHSSISGTSVSAALVCVGTGGRPVGGSPAMLLNEWVLVQFLHVTSAQSAVSQGGRTLAVHAEVEPCL